MRKKFLVAFTVFVLIIIPLSSIATSGSEENKADLVLLNGKIWTADPDCPGAEAIAIKGEHIIAVGTTEDIKGLIGRETEVVDLKGKRAIPGFNDAHCHGMLVGMFTYLLGNMGINLFEPAMSSGLMAKVEKVFFYWICTICYAVWEKCPIAVAAMFMPMLLAWLSLVENPIDFLTKGVEFASNEMAEMGITSEAELAVTNFAMIEAFEKARDEGKLKTRINYYVTKQILDETLARGMKTGYGDEWVRLLGLKLLSDGMLGCYTAALREPYSDMPGWNGMVLMSQETANMWVLKAHKVKNSHSCYRR